MRSLFFTLSLLIFGLACSASQVASKSTSDTPVAEATVALDSLAWTTDLKTANKMAKANDLKVLMVFSGSDWCRPCQQFKLEVLKNETFEDVAKDQVVILYVDFPAKKRNKLSEKETAANAALAEQYNKTGAFPKVLLMPSDDEANPCELKYKGQSADEWLTLIREAIESCAS